MLSPLSPRLRNRLEEEQSPKPIKPARRGPPILPEGPREPATFAIRHPMPRLSFAVAECNPWKLWNLYGLGHWSDFDWGRLLEAAG